MSLSLSIQMSNGLPKMMARRVVYSLLVCAGLIYGQRAAFGQTADSADQTPADQQRLRKQPVVCSVAHVGQCLKDIGYDQAGIWTSPFHLAPKDAIWLLPLAGATGVSIQYDAQAQKNLGINQSRIDLSNRISALGSPYATLGGAAGLYFLGMGTHNEHLAETGRLGAEAVVDASLVVEALKLATNRQRPNEGNGQGGFWAHGTRSIALDGSFPSGHAAASWALARVIASEYPGKLVQVAAYGFALAISASRATARQHFPSDVLVGGTVGYLIGGYAIRHHAAENVASGIPVMPVVDTSTHSFGASMELHPEQLGLAISKVGRQIGGRVGVRNFSSTRR